MNSEFKFDNARESMLQIGKEKNHLMPWAALMTVYAQQKIVLWVLGCGLLISVVCNIFLGYLAANREVWVFVKDHLGEVIQADKDSFLRGNYGRTDAEIKGFTERFLKDAFEFTPLDVKDRVKYFMRFVDSNVQGVVANSIGLRERADLVNHGYSVKLEDDPKRVGGVVPRSNIVRRDPLVVVVFFSRVSVDKTGKFNIIPAIGVQVSLREVPRSPHNPIGFMVVGMSVLNVGINAIHEDSK